MIKPLPYPERRWLRGLEKVWTRVDGLVNHLTSAGETRFRTYNPLYHLGTLSIFLLIVLAVTGTYLTIFYRPGADRAYETVAWMSASWLGSLMRSVHVYAADGLALLLLLHAIKMFISDRFWGSRWLAWVSGWVSLVLVWSIGVMGYWLVWDQRAQWLTEYSMDLLKGSFALSFVSPEIVSETFALFVIILFLHIFLSVLIVVSLLVHVIRLARVRLWSPRWLMIGAGVILTVISLWRPVTSAPPADMSRLVGRVFLDGWYLGFLPFVAHWGSPSIWGLTVLVLALLVALPWLARGRSLGPAVVTGSMCTGCALCFHKCPYGAIEMRPHASSERYESEAVVYPSLCTGCGMCVGTCAAAGANLSGLRTAALLDGLKHSLTVARATGPAPVIIFTCQRHAALGTLPEFASQSVEELGKWQAKAEFIPLIPSTVSQQANPIALGSWSATNPHPRSLSLLTCTLPCVGMLQPEWVRQNLAQGAQAVLVVSCPADDCSFREGPHWLASHLGRRGSLLQQGIHWLETAPGERSAVTKALTAIDDGTAILADRALGAADNEDDSPAVDASLWSKVRSLAAGLIVLTLAFLLALVVQWPATATSQEQGMIRVAITHAGKFKAVTSGISAEIEAKLPENVSPEQVLGGERFPVRLRIEVDEEPAVERLYEPRGLRREGEIYGLEAFSLPPGSHQVSLWLMDDDVAWQPVFSGPVEVEAGRVRTLIFDEGQTVFILQ